MLLAVSDAFYAMYEKAKAESGVVKTSAQRSRTSQDAIGVLNFMKQKAVTESDKEYLEAVRNVISWDSIPQFYTKQISHIKPNDVDAFEQLKEIIPDSYLNTIIEKDQKVGSEPETVLLAEELK